MAGEIVGRRTWSAGRDTEGYREYTILTLVKTDDFDDGPAVVMQTPGLPLPGNGWGSSSLFSNDYDGSAYVTPYMRVSIHQEREGDPTVWWRVEQKASTRPLKRCQDEQVEDPLLEPMHVSGGFVSRTEEATYDRFGNALRNSSHEILRGAQVEFEMMDATVHIEQNVASLELDLLYQFANAVNDDVLWGADPRTIKVMSIQWDEFWAGACQKYYKRIFDFAHRYEGWDRDVPDEGTKVISGYWGNASGTGTGSSDWIVNDIHGSIGGINYTLPIDRGNPQHFIRYKDRRGENARVMLNGNGEPLADGDNPVNIHIERYDELNLLLLGIPATIGD